MRTQYDYMYRGDPGEFARRVGRIPNLEADDEARLIRVYQEHRDAAALSGLYASHQKLIVAQIKRHRLTASFGDALGEANVALHKAIEKFSPEKGTRLSTYATWWIKAALTEMYSKKSIIKTGSTPDDKTARIHLKRALDEVVMPGRDPTQQDLEKIAGMLRVSVLHVEKAYYTNLIGDVSIDSAFVRDGGEPASLYETMADTAPLQDEILEQLDEIENMRGHLTRALEYLDERELSIFKARHMEDPPRTLEDLANVFNITRERVRQIDVRAYEKVQTVIHDGPTQKMVDKWEARRKTAAPETAPA